MSSEKQIEANKANALKSTGPKTAQGKATARRNALKHGMTCAKENLLSSDAKLYKERLERWTKSVKPRNDMELYQLESAVRAAVNLDRCARNAKAKLDQRKRKVAGNWDGVQTKKLNRVVESWATDPTICLAQLEAFTRGCEWLLEQWEVLSKALESNECWTGDEARKVVRLLGKAPEMFPDGDAEVTAFGSLLVAVLPELDPDEADAFLGIVTSQLEPEARHAQLVAKLPSRADALEGLWAMLDAELERLAAIHEKLWESQDGPALSEKIDLASFDGSKRGVLRRRYESANHLDMHRCLKQLTEQRKQHEIRVEEEHEIEKQAKAARSAATVLQLQKIQRDLRLRNEAKSSASKERRISTSGKSGDVDPRAITDPARYIQKVIRPQEPAPQGAPPSNPAAPGAEETQKSS